MPKRSNSNSDIATLETMMSDGRASGDGDSLGETLAAAQPAGEPSSGVSSGAASRGSSASGSSGGARVTGTTAPRDYTAYVPAPAAASAPAGGEPADGLPTVGYDNYQRGDEIARGGMGRILEARDVRMRRPVAIKELGAHGGADAAARFEREALITGQLQHPAIVPVYEAGRWPDGAPFYAMKRVTGHSLDDAIRATENLGDRLALLHHVIAVAEALAYAHDAGVIHRDLKPANVLLGAYGETVVIDWGLAKHVDEDDASDGAGDAASASEDDASGERAANDASERGGDVGDAASDASDASQRGDAGDDANAGAVASEPPSALASAPPSTVDVPNAALTVAGSTMGTPAYMPPEQAVGDPVDRRADVYALGAILYHLLVGAPPYAGAKSAREILARVTVEAPEPLSLLAPDVPADLRAIVEQAMARDPARRYPSARELAEDLRRFSTGQLVRVHEYTTAALVWRWIRRNRAVVSVAAVLLAVLAVVAVASVQRIMRERNVARGERAEADRQRERAERETDRAEARSRALLLSSARGALDSDPTAALAWLAQMPLEPATAPDRVRHAAADDDDADDADDDDPTERPDFGQASLVRLFAIEARARGVARHVLRAPDGKLYGLAISPDGGRLAISGTDGSLQIWDLASGRRLAIDTATPKRFSVAFSPDGRTVATAGDRNALLLWNLESGERRALSGHTGAVQYVAFSPDGERMATSSADLTIRLWDVAAGESQVIARTLEPFNPVRFSPDGGEIVISEDPEPALYDARTLARIPLPAAISPYVLAVSADGRWVLAGGADTTVYAWDRRADAGAGVGAGAGRVVRLAGHSRPVTRFAFGPGGVVAAADMAGEVVLWDLATSAARARLARGGRVDAIAFSPDGTLLATGDRAGAVIVRDLRSGTERTLLGHQGWVTRAAFTPDGHQLVTTSQDGSARVWELRGADGRADHRALSLGDASVTGFVFSPDGRRLAWTDRDGAIGVWDIEGDSVRVLRGHEGPIYSLAFLPARPARESAAPPGADGDVRFATAGADGTVRLWDLATGEIATWRGHERAVVRLAVASDGVSLASAGMDGTVRLWDVGSGQGRVVDRLDQPPRALRFLSGSRTLAYPRGRDLVLWDRSGPRERVLRGHSALILSIAVSPDGSSVATASRDHTVRIWNPHTGDSRPLTGHTDYAEYVMWSDDGALLASAGKEGDIWLWDVEAGTGRELSAHYFMVARIALSPDNTLLASSSTDGTLRLWDLATGASRVWDAIHDNRFNAQFSVDGRWMAAIAGNRVSLWAVDVPSDPAALRAWLASATTATIHGDRAGAPGEPATEAVPGADPGAPGDTADAGDPAPGAATP